MSTGMFFSKDPGNPWWLLVGVAIIALFVILGLTGCGSAKQADAGSARSFAAGENARASSLIDTADAAETDAAAKEARAKEYERLARESGTQARIDAAVAARLDAAVARAIADSTRKNADTARTAAADAQAKAEAERIAQAKAAADASWIYLCRILGLCGLVAGALLGGLISWLVNPRVGIPVGGGIVTVALLVPAYGQTITWLPLALGGSIIVGLVLWAVFHRNLFGGAVALSGTVDALESGVASTIDAAKRHLHQRIDATGMRKRLRAARAAIAKKLTEK